MKKIFDRLERGGGITEITNRRTVLGTAEDLNKLLKREEDLYYITYKPNSLYYAECEKDSTKKPRAKDVYIEAISYWKMDIDLRENFQKLTGEIISDEQIKQYIHEIVRLLNTDELLKNPTLVVFTGNGAHISYIGQMTTIDAKTYKNASLCLLERVRQLFKDKPGFWPDMAVINIARLLRVVGSKNYKSKFGLAPKKVEIVEYHEEDNQLITKLPELGKQYEEKEKFLIEKTKSGKLKCNFSFGLSYGDTLFEAINKIDIVELVSNYTGWRLAPNGENFISNRDGHHVGAYVVRDENILVHVGTPHLDDSYVVYSPFLFVKQNICNGDNKATFEWFLENYKELKKFNKKFLFNNLVYNGK